MIRILILVTCFLFGDAFVALRSPSSSVMMVSSSTAVFYQDEQTDTAAVLATTLPAEEKTEQQQKKPRVVIQIRKKPTVYPLTDLNELNDFLQEDDDRLTAIKFYAPWCKTCQRLGLGYQKLAMQRGDGVDRVARKAITGEMRFAEVEFGSHTDEFIHDQLQIKAIPTLQLYKGTTKLWEGRGRDSIKQLTKEVQQLLSLSQSDLEDYVANDVEDDGILAEAIEESFFDNAYED